MKTTNEGKLLFLWTIFSLILSHVAYAQERKVSRKITGANLQLKGDDIQKQSSTNALQTL